MFMFRALKRDEMFQVRGYISEVGFLDIVELGEMPCQKMGGGNYE